MEPEVIFTEKQYMGHNRLSIMWRTIMALVCFVGYYWSENPKPVKVAMIQIGSYPVQGIPNSGTVFFLVGLLILVLSIGLTFVLHTHTRVYGGYMIIDGFWNARKVKIDFTAIKYIRRSRYKKNLWRRAVYNLHSKGIIKFYTSGQEFIELKDNSGFTYRIGTQRSSELYKIVKAEIEKVHSEK